LIRQPLTPLAGAVGVNVETLASSLSPVKSSFALPITSGHESADVRWTLAFRRGNSSPDAISDRLLVSCSITQEKSKALPMSDKGSGKSVSRSPKDSVLAFDVYPASVRVMRPAPDHCKDNVAPDRTGSELMGFSKKSKSRLRFLAANSADHIQSQFCLTYADDFPNDGKLCKKHLNLFLVNLRYHFPDLKYIWVGEFQTRGAPHFHMFLNLPVTQDNQEIMASLWHKIAGVSQEKHAKFHNHPKNFIPWDMGNGSYLCKYLDKDHQKQIPEGFESFGRWWGNSQNIKPVAKTVTADELNLFVSDAVKKSGGVMTGSVPQFLVRTLCKYQSKVNRSKWAVKRSQTMTVLTGAKVFNQALEYQESISWGRWEK